MTVRIDVFTVFPEYLEAPMRVSLLGRAREAGLVDVRLHDPRDAATDRHRTVDDTPFGGGAGMVMTPEPLFAAVEAAQPVRPLLLLSAAGEPFDQRRARELAAGDGFSLICGRYEGVDQRVADHLCDGELSVGDFVLSGGEAAALVVVEAVVRLVPGVMGNVASAAEESFTEESFTQESAARETGARETGVGEGACGRGGRVLLEYPHYTRPAVFRGWEVPEVLRSGDHPTVERWRRAQALRRTLKRRPDLLSADDLTDEDRALLAEFP